MGGGPIGTGLSCVLPARCQEIQRRFKSFHTSRWRKSDAKVKETHHHCLFSEELVEVRDVDVGHRKPSPGGLGGCAEYALGPGHLENLINLGFVNCSVG